MDDKDIGRALPQVGCWRLEHIPNLSGSEGEHGNLSTKVTEYPRRSNSTARSIDTRSAPPQRRSGSRVEIDVSAGRYRALSKPFFLGHLQISLCPAGRIPTHQQQCLFLTRPASRLFAAGSANSWDPAWTRSSTRSSCDRRVAARRAPVSSLRSTAT